jgi:hypothetical protein
VERQLPAADRAGVDVSVNYLGNVVRNVWTANQINPAVFGPGATPANTNQRPVLFQQNPAVGEYYASIQELDPNGTSNYDADRGRCPNSRVPTAR